MNLLVSLLSTINHGLDTSWLFQNGLETSENDSTSFSVGLDTSEKFTVLVVFLVGHKNSPEVWFVHIQKFDILYVSGTLQISSRKGS